MAINFDKEGIKNVKIVSLHPGVVNTEIVRYVFEAYPFLLPIYNVIYPIFWLLTKSPL